MELFKLLGTIAIDSAEALKALKDAQQEGEKTESKLGKAFSAIGKGAAVAGKAIATGLAVGATAMAGLTMKALSASGELEQNLGGAEAVFGDLGDSISKMSTTVITGYDEATGKAITATRSLEQESKDAYKNMGLSQSDYLATANKMGALFKGAGFETQEALDLSSQAMQRAADVASIMGIDTSAAMEAVAGAAKGNFTMMDNLGVAMNDTAIAAYAASKGINKSTSEMTQQEKIGLAMEMFLEKTSYAAGNYAKENETLAGSLSTAKAAFTNFLAGSGDVDSLVSSFSNLANVVVNSLTEIAPRLTQGLSDLVQQVVPLIPPLLNTLLPVLVEGATTLINGLVSALPGVITAILDVLPLLIDGIMQIADALVGALPGIMQALVAALPTLIPALIDGIISMALMIVEMLPQIIQPLIDSLPTIIISIVEALVNNLPALIEGVIQLTMGIVTALPQIIQSLVDAIPTIVSLLVEAILGNLPALITGLIQVTMGIVAALPQILGALISAIPAALKGIIDGIKNVFSPLASWFSDMWGKLGNVPGLSSMKTMIEQVWGAIKGHISTVINAIKNVITTYWDAIKNVISTAINAIKNVISTTWNAIKTIISNVMKLISSVLKGDWEGVRTAISNILNAIKSVISSVWNGIKSVISSVLNGITSVVSSVWNGIVSVISSYLNTIKTVISSVWNGIKNTISSVVNGIKTTASKGFKEVASKVTGALKDLPSKLKSIGKDLISGLWNGINDKFGWLTDKIKGFANNVTDKLKSFFGIHSPSTVMRDEVGRYLAEGVAEGIDLNAEKAESAAETMGDAIVTAAETRLDKFKTTNTLTLAEEAGYWDEVRRLCTEGTDARLKADKKYLEAKSNLNTEFIAAEEKLQSSLSGIQGKFTERKQSILDRFDLFDEDDKSAFDVGLNLYSQVKTLEDYQKRIDTLQSRIDGTGLYEEVKNMGLDGFKYVEMLNTMSDDELQNLVTLHDKRSELAANLAQDELGDWGIAEAQSAYQTFAETCNGLGIDIVGDAELMKIGFCGYFGEIKGAIDNATTSLVTNSGVFDKLFRADFIPSFDVDSKQTSDTIDKLLRADFIPSFGKSVQKTSDTIDKLLRADFIPSFGESVKETSGSIDKLLQTDFISSFSADNKETIESPSIYDYGSISEIFGNTPDNAGNKKSVVEWVKTIVEQNSTMTGHLQKIIEVLGLYFPQLIDAFDADIYLDTGVLVGELAEPMNEALGRLSIRKDRGR